MLIPSTHLPEVKDPFLLLGNEIQASGVWESHYGGAYRNFLHAQRIDFLSTPQGAVQSGAVTEEENKRLLLKLLKAAGKQKLAEKMSRDEEAFRTLCHDPFKFCMKQLDFLTALSLWRLIWGPGTPIPPSGLVEALRFFYLQHVFPSPEDLDEMRPRARFEKAREWLFKSFRVTFPADLEFLKTLAPRRGLKVEEKDGELFYHDCRVDAMLNGICRFLEQLPENSVPLDEHSALPEIAGVLDYCGALIITGAAGTGKTTLLNSLAEFLEREAGPVLSCSLTGRAAAKLRNGMTLAWALGGARLKDRFPEGYRAILVDEVSQFGLYHLSRTIRALHPTQKLVLVGDPNQLPPIDGPRVFHWLIREMEKKGLVLELKTRHRFDQNCRVVLIEYSTYFQARFIAAVFAYASELEGQDWFFLSPIHRGGLGVRALNRVAREALKANKFNDFLNAAYLSDGPYEIEVGDRVMPVANVYDGRELVLRNKQDVGTVLAINGGRARVLFGSEVTTIDLDKLAPAYALEFWSAEGQEVDRCLIACPDANWVRNIGGPREPYVWETVSTRARKLTVILVKEGGWPRFLREGRISFETVNGELDVWKRRAAELLRKGRAMHRAAR